MKKLKYGLLLILSMILFSVPVLAAKTYYLPSKMVRGSGDEYYTYSYDKYGHMIGYSEHGDDTEGGQYKWKFKYDKKGKRISGDEYINGKLCYKLTFDKNDHLKSAKWVGSDNNSIRKFKWNAKGYTEGSTSDSTTYKYSYYNNGKIKKLATFYDGELYTVAYFDKSGLRSKNPPAKNGHKETYEYIYDKNGLVKTKIITMKSSDSESSTQLKVSYYYSKTKTDAKTYYLFIDEWDSCRYNGNL